MNVAISLFHSRCSAIVGMRLNFTQFLSLYPPFCTTTGTAIHEAMHTLGFWHTQSRIDRDFYVEVVYQNMRPSK